MVVPFPMVCFVGAFVTDLVLVVLILMATAWMGWEMVYRDRVGVAG